MAATLATRPEQRRDAWSSARAALAAAGRAEELALANHEEVRALVVGRPRLAQHPHNRRPATTDVAEHVATRFRTAGARVLADLRGSFALAVVDEARGEVLLAIDRMGIESLVYQAAPGGLVFASRIDALLQHPDAGGSISDQGLFNYLYFHMVPGPGTILENVRRLLPGEWVHLRKGVLTSGRHWEMTFQENRRGALTDLQREFREALEAGVADACTSSRVGAFLSGGTDSSTIAGLLCRVQGGPADTYSIGFDAAGYDEMAYARLAARHFGTRHHEYYVTPADVVAAVPKLAEAYDQPFGNSSAVPTYYCAKVAHEDGIEIMLGGDGGDELFGGNARYATQHVFSHYQRVPGLLRQVLLEPAAAAIAAGPRLPLISKAASYVNQARVPMPERLETYNLLRRAGYSTVFTEDLLQRVDVHEPVRLLEAAYLNPSAGSLINRMLALDLKFTLADNDLPKVTRTCELAGIAIAFPMLDERVVAFSAGLAPDEKLKGTRLRHFFKEALRGFLPDEIIAKQKHGFGLPFGEWAVSHRALRELAGDTLLALDRRHLFNSAFLRSLIDTRLSEHAGYYGTMIWVLMMLEQWFQHHVDSRAAIEKRQAA